MTSDMQPTPRDRELIDETAVALRDIAKLTAPDRSTMQPIEAGRVIERVNSLASGKHLIQRLFALRDAMPKGEDA